ncbi:cytochrome c oxidase assembly factor 5-like [Drosophila miranda]|uniref:cytochrome c oxidase assembly factor 5-like n=1 Tax=Drosophila miranda TaxID=7229 RepID=UPI00143F5063|nr:cytochrome c oxidase assembly factor 5-like [Drosophila miranda]
MMRYEGNEKLADETACAGVRADLKMCLLESDYCRVDRKTPRQCLIDNNVPPECQVLRNTFYECKRSLLDNRQRFRGRKGY